MLILLYIHQDDWLRVHPFGLDAGEAPRCHIPEFLSCSNNILPDTLPALFIPSVDFNALSMTRHGTLAFVDGQGYAWFIIDAQGLDAGRITVVEFNSSGGVCASASRRPWNMGQVMGYIQMGRLVSDIVDSSIGGPPQYNEPYLVLETLSLAGSYHADRDGSLDMDLPILELLEITGQDNKFLHPAYLSANREVWTHIIEESAPGYLELEAQGREVDFEPDDLREID